jgi:hypothetical protein
VVGTLRTAYSPVKKPKLLLAALALLIGAASAAGSKPPGGAEGNGESAMLLFKSKGRS